MTDVACGGRDQDSLRDALLRRLRDAQLDGLTGKVLYSGINTLKKGPLYLLGFNPGGDPAKETMTLAEHVTQSPSAWNEYLDAKWGAPGGGWRPPGQAPLQRRVQWLLNQLGLQTREVCASNLIFNRSIDQARLNDWSGVADRRWPIHDWIIKLVQPHAILCLGGGKVFDYICGKGRPAPIVSFPSGHGDWECCATKVQLESGTVQLISVPHLSRYNICSHPEVAAWIRRASLAPNSPVL